MGSGDFEFLPSSGGNALVRRREERRWVGVFGYSEMESGDGQACTDRTVDQGTSVLNFSDSGTAKGNHLVVMVHGILGR